jgi:hypothetical protein
MIHARAEASITIADEEASARAVAAQYISKWSMPAWPDEERVARKILRKRRFPVVRLNAAYLRSQGCQNGMCHSNVLGAVRVTPSSKHVIGWVPEGPLLIVHSVLWDGRKYVCVTPAAGAAPTFDFIPDPRLTFERRDSFIHTYLDGREISDRFGLRADLKRVRHVMDEARSCLRDDQQGGLASIELFNRMAGK